MSENQARTRVCPTRIDGAAPLFVHRVTTEQCQERQRARYHKCYTCRFNNAVVAELGMPDPTPQAVIDPVAEPAATPELVLEESDKPAVSVG